MRKVLVGGCFNSIHPGHIYFLQKARSLGDFLIVVLTHDSNNKKPYAVSARKRKRMLIELGIADKIVVGDPKNPMRIVIKERPDTIALGYDQKISWLKKELKKQKMKCKLIRIKRFGEYSTSGGRIF